jgi:universal stress protein A
MDAKTILFATDFSPASDVALTWATSLARYKHAKLVILHVEQPRVPDGGGEIYSSYILDYHSDSLMKRLENVTPADSQVCYTHRLASGDPATEILRVADEVEADMIVMSTHGRSGLPRMLMGSVAENVVRLAHCPVVIVKQPHCAKQAHVGADRPSHDFGIENHLSQNGHDRRTSDGKNFP